jgi:hypothetical protein
MPYFPMSDPLICAHLRNLRQAFAFPIPAISRDYGDFGNLS